MSKLDRIQQRKEALENIRKNAMTHHVICDLLDSELAQVRERYESTQPASEFLRGQLIALKTLRNEIGDR